MKITSIKQQVKNPERVSIFLDGKYSFSLSLDELVAEGIKNNDEIDGARLKNLKKLSDDGKLRQRALEWTLSRPHSTREFKDYMWRRNAEPQLTENLIDEFTQKKYLNDVGYGAWLVELRQRSGKSNRQIKNELFKKGLSREEVAAVLEGQEGSELERIRAIVTKKINLTRYRDNPQKLAKYLVTQGFSYADVKQALALDAPED